MEIILATHFPQDYIGKYEKYPTLFHDLGNFISFKLNIILKSVPAVPNGNTIQFMMTECHGAGNKSRQPISKVITGLLIAFITYRVIFGRTTYAEILQLPIFT